MMKMSWTHYSKILVVGVLLALALGVAGTAAAGTFSDDEVPEEAEVGEQMTVTVTMDDPFEERSPGWTVVAETGFDDPNVTISARTPSETYREDGDESAEMTLDDEAITEVEFEVSGEVPEIEEFNYEDKDEENFDLLTVSDSGTQIEQWSVHRFTEESKEARNKIDEASEKVGDDDDALSTAISLYNNADFEQAIAEAQDIIDDAESEQQTQQLLLFGGIGVVVVLLAGGGYYVYLQRKQDTNKLQ